MQQDKEISKDNNTENSVDISERKCRVVTHCEIPIGMEMACLFTSGTKTVLRFIGYDEGEFLLFKFPSISNVASYLALDTAISAVFQHDGYKVLFKSSIKFSLPKRRLGFFHYPANFRMYEIRAKERVNCLVPVSINIEQQYVGVMEDLSLTGCKVTFDGIYGTSLRDIGEGNEYILNIWTPTKKLEIKAKVIRVEKSFTRTSLGMVFGEVEKQKMKTLMLILDTLR